MRQLLPSLLTLLAAAGAVVRDPAAGRAAPEAAWVDAHLRMEARWARRPEPDGAPTLPHLPTRAAWEDCFSRGLHQTDCATVQQASLPFPPADRGQSALLGLNPTGWAKAPAPTRLARVCYNRSMTGVQGIEQLLGGTTHRAMLDQPLTDERVALTAQIQRGVAVDLSVWQRPGLAGLAALEQGAYGDPVAIPALLDQSLSGPTAADRMAALYAALRLGEGLTGLPAQHPAVVRARAIVDAGGWPP